MRAKKQWWAYFLQQASILAPPVEVLVLAVAFFGRAQAFGPRRRIVFQSYYCKMSELLLFLKDHRIFLTLNSMCKLVFPSEELLFLFNWLLDTWSPTDRLGVLCTFVADTFCRCWLYLLRIGYLYLFLQISTVLLLAGSKYTYLSSRNWT